MNHRTLLRRVLTVALCSAAAHAHATPQCTVATGAQLNFGAVVALASSGDKTTDSGSSFWVNCNSEVVAAPQLYSSSVRAMVSGAATLPFRLALVSPGSADLPAASPGAVLGVARNATNQVVTLYGKIRAADFKSLPGGLYSTAISLTIEY